MGGWDWIIEHCLIIFILLACFLQSALGMTYTTPIRAQDIEHKNKMEFDKRCCRCARSISIGKEIGGSYGGVVCTNHRSCHQCWFGSNYWYGKRKREPTKTKRIALIDSKTEQGHASCFGCYYAVPFHISTRAKLHAAERINKEYQEKGFLQIDSDWQSSIWCAPFYKPRPRTHDQTPNPDPKNPDSKPRPHCGLLQIVEVLVWMQLPRETLGGQTFLACTTAKVAWDLCQNFFFVGWYISADSIH